MALLIVVLRRYAGPQGTLRETETVQPLLVTAGVSRVENVRSSTSASIMIPVA